MHVLVIKTSSMGDIIHTLPALTDAKKNIPNIHFDWVVEEDFAEIPSWHSSVECIIPIALRQWRKKPLDMVLKRRWQPALKAIREKKYDFIIDAQGLTKSAVLARFASGIRCGLDSQSARDPVAFLHYQQRYHISWDQHAVSRIRELFAKILNYPVPKDLPHYGINLPAINEQMATTNYLVFLPATTWATKLYPEEYWHALVQKAIAAGFTVKITGGNDAEIERAKRIAGMLENTQIVGRQSIKDRAALLAGAKGIIAVDTGLAHLAAALAKPTVSIYGSTNPLMTGAFGHNQVHLKSDLACAPCLQRECSYKETSIVAPACYTLISPEHVWENLLTLVDSLKGQICD